MYSLPTVASHRCGWRCLGRWLSASAALVDSKAPTHSTAHASDIISHVTLIFESSRYVDCIRSASASALQYSFLPSFLPPFSSRTSNYFVLFALSLSLFLNKAIYLSIYLFLPLTFVFLSRRLCRSAHVLYFASFTLYKLDLSLRQSTVLTLFSIV